MQLVAYGVYFTPEPILIRNGVRSINIYNNPPPAISRRRRSNNLSYNTNSINSMINSNLHRVITNLTITDPQACI